MQEKNKFIGIIVGAGLVLFFAGFSGSFFAIKSFEPQVKIMLQRQESTKGLSGVTAEIFTLSGKLLEKRDNLIVIETEPPKDPFIEWQKEIEFAVNKNTVIVLGEWDGETQTLIETPIAFGQLELGRIVIVVPSDDVSWAGNTPEAEKIIVGKPR